MAEDRKLPPADDPGEPPPLPADATDVLAGWATGDVPEGFADRVVAATHPGRAARPGRRRWPIAAIAAAVLAVAASLAVLRGGGGAAEAGARVVQQRESLALGRRGVAVAEAGTALSWTIAAGGSTEVHQTRGDVFYRVEKGGPFRVETPHGQVIVRGTCFRVEVRDMKVSKNAWLGGAIGAAVAATVVIAVYEGGVRVVNAHGQTDARAGERVVLRPGAAPTPLAADAPSPALAALEPPPADSATVPDLLRRDQAHRGEIALLRTRVRALETAGAAPAAPPARRDRDYKIIDLSHDELVEMAKRCEIRFDVPGYGLDPRPMNDKIAEAEQLSAGERAIYDQLVRKESERYMAALRALYHEATGSDGDTLDAYALATEIRQKSPRADVLAARKRLAEERSGLVPPAAEVPVTQPVIERMFRLQTTAGDALERLLAAEFGADKAHQLRASGWAGGDTTAMSGCED